MEAYHEYDSWSAAVTPIAYQNGVTSQARHRKPRQPGTLTQRTIRSARLPGSRSRRINEPDGYAAALEVVPEPNDVRTRSANDRAETNRPHIVESSAVWGRTLPFTLSASIKPRSPTSNTKENDMSKPNKRHSPSTQRKLDLLTRARFRAGSKLCLHTDSNGRDAGDSARLVNRRATATCDISASLGRK